MRRNQAGFNARVGFKKAHFSSQAEGAGIIQGEEKALWTP